MTRLDREVDRAIGAENRRYLARLEAAGPDACPNCLGAGGCWLCEPHKAVDARGRPLAAPEGGAR